MKTAITNLILALLIARPVIASPGGEAIPRKEALSAVVFPGETFQAVLAVHGGYAPDKPDLSPALHKAYCQDLKRALEAGYKSLSTTNSALSSVEAAVKVLEDSPHFNAGRGAVFSLEGKNELDASIMEGATKRAGAVAGVRRIKNPISLARAVMDKTPHVFLIGDGAEAFARTAQIEFVSPKYFWTERRWKQHQADLAKNRLQKNGASFEVTKKKEFSTVGSVALDASGTLAAATSTGGLSGKRHGRVGDSPILGAGTYADNRGAAVSATGHGEYFIRHHVASAISDQVRHGVRSLAEAARFVLTQELSKEKGEGSVIAMDAKGTVVFQGNSEGMLRGYIDKTGKSTAFVYEQKCPS